MCLIQKWRAGIGDGAFDNRNTGHDGASPATRSGFTAATRLSFKARVILQALAAFVKQGGQTVRNMLEKDWF